MENLGLNALNEEQLIELLNECLYEVCRRDGYLHQLAQNCIYSRAEQLKDIRTWYEELIRVHREQERAELKAETARYFQEWVKDQCTLSPAEERKTIDEGFKEGRNRLALSALTNPSIPLDKRLSAAFNYPEKLYVELSRDATGTHFIAVGWARRTVQQHTYTGMGGALAPPGSWYEIDPSCMLIGLKENRTWYYNSGSSGTWDVVQQDKLKLKNSAPLPVIQQLLGEFGRGVVCQMELEPARPAVADALKETALKADPLYADPPEPGPDFLMNCPRCGGMSYSAQQGTCKYCRFTHIL